jgi:hypothetical protein
VFPEREAMLDAPDMNSLTLRSPVDVIAAVPYLFGFHPTNSLVLVGLDETRVSFQARVDAPDSSGVAGVVEYLTAIARRQAAAAVLLVGYGPPDAIDAALTELRWSLMSAGILVYDWMRVHDGRYYSPGCVDPVCCPPEGTPIDPSATSVAATATYAGLVALPDRAALVDGLSPVPGPGIGSELDRAAERLAELRAGGARRQRAQARAAVREALDRYASGGRLSDDEVAWLAVLLTDVRSRDEAWQRMLAQPPCDEHIVLWRDVVRRLPAGSVAAPATLLALAAWRAGDGALASIAVDRALGADPDYTLAGLVLQALNAGISPAALEPLPRSPQGRLTAGAG